jgi:hypothetical protein
MAKPIKTRDELETMIADEVRRRPYCEGFRSITVYGIVDESAAGRFNWAVSVANFGEAEEASCEAALWAIIPRFQSLYDLAPE